MVKYSQRVGFEKLLLKSVRELIKGTGWGIKQNSLFVVRNEYFIELKINVARNSENTVLVLSAKPMKLDPLYWEITGLSENLKQPLSFRSVGAFCCNSLPFYEFEIFEASINENVHANSILAWARDHVEKLLKDLEVKDYSEYVSSHINQRERSAYAITLITSLIIESKLEEAKALASEYVSGKKHSVVNHIHGEKSFYQLALEWKS